MTSQSQTCPDQVNMKAAVALLLVSALAPQLLLPAVDAGYAPRQDCHTVYETVTSYEQQCSKSYEQECSTEQEQQCSTAYETRCSTTHEQQCSPSAYGSHSKSCRQVPKESCKQVPK